MENKPTFWQYLKANHFWALVIFTLIVAAIMVYWILSYGWFEVKPDIIRGICILAFTWSVWILGDYLTWKKL